MKIDNVYLETLSKRFLTSSRRPWTSSLKLPPWMCNVLSVQLCSLITSSAASQSARVMASSVYDGRKRGREKERERERQRERVCVWEREIDRESKREKWGERERDREKRETDRESDRNREGERERDRGSFGLSTSTERRKKCLWAIIIYLIGWFFYAWFI